MSDKPLFINSIILQLRIFFFQLCVFILNFLCKCAQIKELPIKFNIIRLTSQVYGILKCII